MHEVFVSAREQLASRVSELSIQALSELVDSDDGRPTLTMEIVLGETRVPIEVRLPVSFPCGELEVFLKDPAWIRHEHQSSNGKLCLRPDESDDRGPDRLLRVIEGTIGWLKDAQGGSLAGAGERFELPDFPESYQYTSRVVFDDEATDANRWRAHIGGSGALDLVEIHGGWAVGSMADRDARVVAQATTIQFPTSTRRVPGRWLLLDRFSTKGHRAPAAWSELEELSLQVERERYLAWRDSNDGFSCLLVGFPVPSVVGGILAWIHWQPIFFLSYDHARRAQKTALKSVQRSVKGARLTPTTLWPGYKSQLLAKPVPWGYAEDVSARRLYARASEDAPAFRKPVLIGCGALGSVIADCWVRSGLRNIGLIDRDHLEHGNLCRHVLNATSVGLPKSTALADHLRRASPAVIATAAEVFLPPRTTKDAAEFVTLRKSADLLVDASGNDEVLGWLETPEGSGLCQVASVWTNSDASIGIGVLSGTGGGVGVASLRARVVSMISEGLVQGCDLDTYRGPAPIYPGVGCWHPTFAGSWARIVGLGAALSEWLRVSARGHRQGRAIVFLFKDGGWRKLGSWTIDAPAGTV